MFFVRKGFSSLQICWFSLRSPTRCCYCRVICLAWTQFYNIAKADQPACSKLFYFLLFVRLIWPFQSRARWTIFIQPDSWLNYFPGFFSFRTTMLRDFYRAWFITQRTGSKLTLRCIYFPFKWCFSIPLINDYDWWAKANSADHRPFYILSAAQSHILSPLGTK